MALETRTGAYALELLESVQGDTEGNPLLSYVNVSPYKSETWTEGNYDPEALKRSLTSTSAQGSSVSLTESYSAGPSISEAISLTFKSGNGDSFVGSSTYGWTESTNASGLYSYSENDSLNFSWSYLGNKASTSDDLTIKVSRALSEKGSDGSGSGQASGTETFSYSISALGTLGIAYSVSGQTTWGGSYGSLGEKYTSTGSISAFSYKNVNDGLTVTIASGSKKSDSTLAYDTLTISGATFDLNGLKIATASASTIVSSSALNIDFSDLDSLTPVLTGELLPLLYSASNTITGSAGDDVIRGSLGNDIIDGGAGSDLLDLSHSDNPGWSYGLNDRGSSTYTVTGTEKAFVISYVGADYKAYKMTVNNVEQIVIGGEQVSAAKFLAPNSTLVSGSDVIGWIMQDTGTDENGDVSLPLLRYSQLADFSGESWSESSWNPDAASRSLTSRSAEGSTLTLSETSTKTATGGSESSTVSFSAAGSKAKLTGSSSDIWNNTATSGTSTSALNYTWTYTGDASIKSDDLTISFTKSESSSWKSATSGGGTWGGSNTFSLTYDSGAGKGNQLKLAGSSKNEGAWSADGTDTKDVDINNFTTISWTDVESNFGFLASGTIVDDWVNGYSDVAFTSATLSSGGVKYATSNYKRRIAVSDFTADPTDLSTLTSGLGSLLPGMLSATNTITGSTADDTIVGSLGNDTVDGAAGSDTLDLSSFAWSLTDRGSSTYTVTGTEKAFVISYVGEDAKAYKMTVNNVERVSIGGEEVSAAKFLAPNTYMLTGGNVLEWIIDDANAPPHEEDSGWIPFLRYGQLGEFSGEAWSEAAWNPDAASRSLSSRSSEGSSLTYTEKSAQTATSGSSEAGITFAASGNRAKFTGSNKESWSETASSGNNSAALNYSWVYSGDSATKSDDLSIIFSQSSVDSWKGVASGAGTWSGSGNASVVYDAAAGKGNQLKITASFKEEGAWDSEGNDTKNVEVTTLSTLSWVDVDNQFSFSATGTTTDDWVNGYTDIALKNVTVQSYGVKTVTAAWTQRIGVDEYSFDLTDPSTLTYGFGSLLPSMLLSANTITGSTADDTIVGSLGNDTVDGAAGSDTLDLSSFAWNLTDRGSSTYTVTGTEKAFVISYVGEDAKAYKMTVNNVERVSIGGEEVSAAKFLAPNTRTLTGGEVLGWIAGDTDPEDGLPFVEHLALQSFIDQEWVGADYNPDAATRSFSSKSGAGSVVTLQETQTSAVGKTASTFNLGLTSLAGDKLTMTQSDSYTSTSAASSETYALTYAWTYVGDKAVKTDDLSITLTVNDKVDEKYTAGVRTSRTNTTTLSWNYNAAQGLGNQYAVTGTFNRTSTFADGNYTLDKETMTFTAYKFVDVDNRFALSMTGSTVYDAMNGTLTLALNNVVVKDGGLTITTAKFNATVDDDGSKSDVLSISDIAQTQRDYFLPLMYATANTITGSTADDTIVGSLGNDTVDGAAGSDTLDLSSFAWNLTDRGSSTYTVTGTEKAFVISYVGEDAKAYKMTVNNVERVIIGGEDVATGQFLAPNSVVVGGDYFLNKLASETITAEVFPTSFTSIGPALNSAERTWTTSRYDPDALNTSYTSTSSIGEKLTITIKDVAETAKGYGNSFSVAYSSVKGDKLGFAYSETVANTLSAQNVRTGGSSSVMADIAWTYVGETSTKADDVSMSLKGSSVTTDSTAANGTLTYKQTDTITMSYTDAAYKLTGSGSYSLNYVETSSGARTSDIEVSAVTGFSYSDFNGGVYVSLGSGVRTTDAIKGTDELKITSLSVKTPEITMTTASATLRASDGIPDVDFGFDPGSAVAGLGEALVASLSEALWNFDNVVTVNSADGLSVYAGAGNDTLTGGKGSDRLSGGKGRDTLTGGLGADTFVISGSDLVAADADTFTDFNIAQGDRIEFDGDTGMAFSLDNFELGTGANSATGANLIYSGGSLYWDGDGVGGSSGVLIATIGSRPTFKTKDEYAALFGG